MLRERWGRTARIDARLRGDLARCAAGERARDLRGALARGLRGDPGRRLAGEFFLRKDCLVFPGMI